MDTLTLPTAAGDTRAYVDHAALSVATLVLGHGAGGGSSARDLVALAAALPTRGITVARVDQPWRVAGRRVAPAPAVLDRAWLAAVPAVLDRLPVTAALVVGGRSAGARVACRTAGALRAAAVIALAFPLHPPGRPERSRAGELATGTPLLVIQGARDAFGRPGEFPTGVDVRSVPGGDHSFARGDLGPVVDLVADWIRALPPDRL